VSMLFVHWVNAAPAPSDEHKVLKLVPLSTLKDILSSGAKLPLEENGLETYGFLHGHDSMLQAVLQDPKVLNLCKEMTMSK
jgi:hypothetical protein